MLKLEIQYVYKITYFNYSIRQHLIIFFLQFPIVRFDVSWIQISEMSGWLRAPGWQWKQPVAAHTAKCLAPAERENDMERITHTVQNRKFVLGMLL